MFIALLSDLANKIKLIHFRYSHDVLRMRSNLVITILNKNTQGEKRRGQSEAAVIWVGRFTPSLGC